MIHTKYGKVYCLVSLSHVGDNYMIWVVHTRNPAGSIVGEPVWSPYALMRRRALTKRDGIKQSRPVHSALRKKKDKLPS